MRKYGGDTTVEVVEKAARCTRCTGKNLTSTQIIYVGSSELAVQSLHTPKDNKDLCKRNAPGFPQRPTQELITCQPHSRGNFLTFI